MLEYTVRWSSGLDVHFFFFLKNALFLLKHKYLTTNKCPVEETCRQLWPWRIKSRTGVRGEAENAELRTSPLRDSVGLRVKVPQRVGTSNPRTH